MLPAERDLRWEKFSITNSLRHAFTSYLQLCLHRAIIRSRCLRIWLTFKFSKLSMIASVADRKRSITSISKSNIEMQIRCERPEFAGTG